MSIKLTLLSRFLLKKFDRTPPEIMLELDMNGFLTAMVPFPDLLGMNIRPEASLRSSCCCRVLLGELTSSSGERLKRTSLGVVGKFCLSVWLD